MRIVLFSFYFSPDLCAGSFRCTALVEQLKALDVDVDVITTMPNRYASFAAQAPAFEEQGRVRIHRIALPSHKSGMADQIKAFKAYYQAAFRLIDGRQYDVVVGTSSRLFTAFLASRVARARKLPLYLDIRDIFVDTIKDVLPKKISRVSKPVFELIEKYTFRRAGRINLVSAGFAEYFQTRYSQCDYRYFTNGIDQEFLDAAPTNQGLPQAATPRESGRPIRVLYAGNIGEGQGLHTIVPQLSAALGPSVLFRVIGDGGRLAQLQQAVSGNAAVELLPPMDRSQLIAEYQAADVLFLHLNDYPAFTKVLPSKIFEYAALGKPMLAGVSGYAAKFLAEHVNNCGVFHPSDVNGAVNAFSTLQLQDTPRHEFIERFDRHVIMQQMAADIVEFASNGGFR